MSVRIALIGDYNPEVTAHQAIPPSLALAGGALSLDPGADWIDSVDLKVEALADYHGVWCVPASPYENRDNILSAIGYCRRHNLPFLGTCGGYQHAVLEFARSVLAMADAENTEEVVDAGTPLIAALSCALREVGGNIKLSESSRVAAIYQTTSISEEYNCGYGVNRDYLSLFDGSDLSFTGHDMSGDPRVFELDNHAFFIGTAFQPERSSLQGKVHPLVQAFLKAAADSATAG